MTISKDIETGACFSPEIFSKTGGFPEQSEPGLSRDHTTMCLGRNRWKIPTL